MVKARKFVLARAFEGEVQPSDLKLVEEDLPSVGDGQVLCEAVYLSVDPYQRAFGPFLKVGDTMLGSQVAKIVESRHPDFPVGRHLLGYWGWRDRCVVNPKETTLMFPPPTLIPDLNDLPLSLALGVLGMPGNAACIGLLDICSLQRGEVVVVSGAAGAVGSHVGQIAKVKGCKVVGFAGSDAKCRWLKDDLNLDAAFNYKTTDIVAALKEVAPEGVDVYFDNVGGEISSAVIGQMRKKGRIAVCGSISSYNSDKQPLVPAVQASMLFNQLRMEGFISFDFLDRWEESSCQNLRWIREGKLKYRETVTEGFENMPKAFIGMMRGENFGKAIVKA